MTTNSSSSKESIAKQHSRVFLLLSCLSAAAHAQTTTVTNSSVVCPALYCDKANTKLAPDTCFFLNEQTPIKQILGQMCYDAKTAKPSDIPKVCPFNLNDGSYGWLQEYLQPQTPLNKLGFEDLSQVKYKKVKEYCVSVSGYG